jgi:hypothetical protein
MSRSLPRVDFTVAPPGLRPPTVEDHGGGRRNYGCEYCGWWHPTSPFPFPNCWYCGAQPSYHHGRCCPRRPRGELDETPAEPVELNHGCAVPTSAGPESTACTRTISQTPVIVNPSPEWLETCRGFGAGHLPMKALPAPRSQQPLGFDDSDAGIHGLESQISNLLGSQQA